MKKFNNEHSNGSPQKVLQDNEKNENQQANGGEDSDIAVEKHTSLHTDSVQQIMTKVPPWVLRWGIAVFFSSLVMILAIASFIDFPDTIDTELKIQSTDMGKKVVSSASGVITSLYVRMGDPVKKGQPLLAIGSAENSDQLYTLYAPESGKVASTAVVDRGYFLIAGQEVFVIHSGNEHMYGITEIPANKISEIKQGQDVLISLNSYDTANGQVTGKIHHIADEPVNGKFMVSVDLNYSRRKTHVELAASMSASAKIITGNTTLLDRLLTGIEIKNQ